MAASGATSSTGKPPAALDAFLAEVSIVEVYTINAPG